MNEYHIQVCGHLDLQWSAWLQHMAITHEEDGTTLLSGQLPDQAAVYGVLIVLRDIGAHLLSVRHLGNGQDSVREASGGTDADCNA